MKKRRTSSSAKSSSSASSATQRSQGRILSRFNFSSKSINIGTKNKSCSLMLESGENICFHGSVDLVVVNGTVNVLGFEATPESGKISLFSHLWNPGALLELVAVDNSLIELRTSTSRLAEHKSSDAATLAYSTNALSIDRFYPVVRNYDPDSNVTFGPVMIPQSWKAAMDPVLSTMQAYHSRGPFSKLKPPVIAICGPRNSGKSTLLRYTINTLLSKGNCQTIGLMDADLGQSETTPCGILSFQCIDKPLLGAPHTHLQDPEYALCFGEHQSGMDPAKYVKYVLEVYKHYVTHHTESGQTVVPLVINTQGWVKDLGKEMLWEILNAIDVTHVIELSNVIQNTLQAARKPMSVESSVPEPAGDGKQGKSNRLLHYQAPLFDLSDFNRSSPPTYVQVKAFDGSHGASSCRIAASKLRDLSMMAYFGLGCATESKTESQQQLLSFATIPAIINKAPTFAVSWNHMTFVLSSLSLNPELLLDALVLSVVGLCVGDIDMNAVTTSSRGVRVLRSSSSSMPKQCIGLGLIRALDVHTRTLYMITPLSQEVLQSVTICMLGNLPLPTEFLYETSQTSTHVPFLTSASISTGVDRMKSRGNLKRKQFD